MTDPFKRGIREVTPRSSVAGHEGREPSDPPNSYPPSVVNGSGSRSPTIDRHAMRFDFRPVLEGIIGKVLWGAGVGIVAWVGARVSSVRDDIRNEMVAVAASAAASAVQHKFDDHPPDAFGRPQPSLSDRLEAAAKIVEWTGHEADAQARTDRDVADLKSRVGELEKRKPK